MYLYDFTVSFESLNVTELPPIEQFYSFLKEQSISAEDYTHAQIVWKILSVRDLGHYSDIYLMTDVLLLADVFENFRINCMLAYGMDPAHFYTLAGFTWDGMLKFTRVKLERFLRIDMLLFTEKGNILSTNI